MPTRRAVRDEASRWWSTTSSRPQSLETDFSLAFTSFTTRRSPGRTSRTARGRVQAVLSAIASPVFESDARERTRRSLKFVGEIGHRLSVSFPPKPCFPLRHVQKERFFAGNGPSHQRHAFSAVPRSVIPALSVSNRVGGVVRAELGADCKEAAAAAV